MKKSAILLFALAVLTSTVSGATDPISAGEVRNLAFRGGYLMFKVFTGSTNHCSPCPPDPGSYGSGSYCWIAETSKTQVSMLLLAKAQDWQINGRVYGITTDCSMYQTLLVD